MELPAAALPCKRKSRLHLWGNDVRGGRGLPPFFSSPLPSLQPSPLPPPHSYLLLGLLNQLAPFLRGVTSHPPLLCVSACSGVVSLPTLLARSLGACSLEPHQGLFVSSFSLHALGRGEAKCFFASPWHGRLSSSLVSSCYAFFRPNLHYRPPFSLLCSSSPRQPSFSLLLLSFLGRLHRHKGAGKPAALSPAPDHRQRRRRHVHQLAPVRQGRLRHRG